MSEPESGQSAEYPEAGAGLRESSPAETDQGIGEHPRGTLLIVGMYGFLFVLGWLILYFFVFLPRGVLTE